MIDDADLVEIEFDLSQSYKPINQSTNQSNNQSHNQSNSQSNNQWVEFKVRLLCANNTKLLDLTRSDDQSKDPSRCFTGLSVYSGAQVLASLICQRPSLFNQSRNILELGCGIGLTGISIINQAFKQTNNDAYLLMTDGEAEAVKLARRNIEQSTSQANNVSVIQASWSAVGRQKIIDHMKQVRSTNQAVSFDLICGTDLLYAKTMLTSIINVSIPLLSAFGILMLVHTPRTVGIHEELQRINQRPWVLDDQTNVELKMFYIKLSSFLDEQTIKRFQWFGIDVCCIVRLSEYESIAQSLQSQGLIVQPKSDIEQAMDEMDKEDQIMGLDWNADDD